MKGTLPGCVKLTPAQQEDLSLLRLQGWGSRPSQGGRGNKVALLSFLLFNITVMPCCIIVDLQCSDCCI